MKRLLLSLLVVLCSLASQAQAIYWVTNCSAKNFCLNQGSCTQGQVYMVEKAETNCGSQNINYSYKIDLNNDGSQDISSSEDTVRGNFALGTHKVIWRASDNCGNVVQCTYLFQIKDCNPPNLLCINGLTQTLNAPDCEISFNASQFVLSANDNCTPSNQIEYGMRILGSGTGFPNTESLSFGKCDKGLNSLEIWVRDGNGLTNQCNNYVLVQIADPVCECNEDADLNFLCCARMSNNLKLSGYRNTVTVQTLPSVTPFFSKIKTFSSTDSCFSVLVNKIPFGRDYQAIIRADKPDGALNGVTTFDLVLMSKHILGIEPLINAYQYEAADVNNSNSVTTSDIVEIRKVILGINDTFAHVPSWRFVRPLANPADLTTFNTMVDTYQVQLPNLQADLNFQGFDFVGIKYGDINFSAALQGDPDERTNNQPLRLTTEDRVLEAGEEAEIALYFEEPIPLEGWQLNFSTVPDALEIVSAPGLPENDGRIKQNDLRAISYTPSFFDAQQPVLRLKVKALRATRLSEALHLNQADLPAEAYYRSMEGRTMRRPIRFHFKDTGNVFLGTAPNPFKDQIDFKLLLDQAASAQIGLFTLDGQQVFSESYDMEPGPQTIRLSASSLPANKLFFYRINIDGQVFSGKLVRI